MAAVRKRKAASTANFNKQADTMHIVSSFGADVDLLGIAGKPKMAPQCTIFSNAHVTDAAAIAFTPEKGVSQVISVPPMGHLPYPHPIKTILTSGTTGGTPQALCGWWDAASLDWNSEA